MSAVINADLVFFSAAQAVAVWASCAAALSVLHNFEHNSKISWAKIIISLLISSHFVQQRPWSSPQVQITLPQDYKGHSCCPMTNHGKAKTIRVLRNTLNTLRAADADYFDYWLIQDCKSQIFPSLIELQIILTIDWLFCLQNVRKKKKMLILIFQSQRSSFQIACFIQQVVQNTKTLVYYCIW